MSSKAPALFIGHGSPMNAIEENAFSLGWRDIARRFERPRAIVCVSAHWTTEGVRVTGNAHPPTIHDFHGFPAELHAVEYPASGAPELAERVALLLTEFGARLDQTWGFDHGAWSVLKWMYPDSDVPVIQLSLDARRTPGEHYEIGRALSAVREDNVLVLATGNIVHNLRAFVSGDTSQEAIAKTFDDFIVERIAARDHHAVINYQTHPAAAEAAPDWDHFIPLLYALGARGEDEPAEMFNRHVATGISMTSIAMGLAPALGWAQ
jgi:4,5-DOPA dioxygenase extradiol